ncbi:MAG: DEAD/DEAH box helicase [Fimbriimonadales bacterium]|nr:MAG: DEAD/DEAH box helicase [Fimbriimonadales bacterium]
MATIFDLHEMIREDHRSFIRSFTNIADERLQEFVEREIDASEKLWPEPLLQLSPHYRRVGTIEELASEGVLDPTTAEIFRDRNGNPFTLYQHQVEALTKAKQDESFVVTSGTGSGKSLCYFLPIFDEVIRDPEAPAPLALIVYPMNALANSQLHALEEWQRGYEERTGKEFPVRFAKYTGETSAEDRNLLQKERPHILLTNYMMLELIMVRPGEREWFAAPGRKLYIVFDELHTYRGRQGADIAMLVRRLKARLNREKVIHIGTSATMVAHKEATAQERREAVAEFASRFFAVDIPETAVIEETLDPITRGGAPTPEELAAALRSPLPEQSETFLSHPLARWVELTFGIEEEEPGRYRRRHPRSIGDAAQALSEETGASIEECEEKLRSTLLHARELSEREGKNLFPFKLHQFFSQGHGVHATIEPVETREFRLEQAVSAEAKIWAPLRLCRVCGQDHYRVIQKAGKFEGYELPAFEEDEDKTFGFLTHALDEFGELEEWIPNEWRSGTSINSTWRDRVPVRVYVLPDGSYSREPAENATPMWWQKRGFWICPRCGEWYSKNVSEWSKLAMFSTEGRSSATTILALSLLHHAKETGVLQAKLLSFTDNRQDASLQAGHFNDFVKVATVRSALYRALNKHKELHYDTVAKAVFDEMKIPVDRFAKGRLDEDSDAAEDAKQVFCRLLEHRLFEDLKRGWRISQPNLEDVGLLRIEFKGLRELCARDELFDSLPGLKAKSQDKRYEILHTLLDYFRMKLALDVAHMNEQGRQQLQRQCEEFLNDFWGIDTGAQSLRRAEKIVILGERNPKYGIRFTAQSQAGRYLRDALDLSRREDVESHLQALLELLELQGMLLRRENRGVTEYQIRSNRIVWKLGDGTPPTPNPMWRRRSRPDEAVSARFRINQYFYDFYRSNRDLAGMEAREHTGQVKRPGAREEREQRFRGEREPQLPLLVCSPTMELGIDIADLDSVHMRNVPPTPANYAQRSGRAGRQGQPGLIMVYCGASSPHDQYFFRRRGDMVAGNVRAPRLDLANPFLLKTHVHAEWLAKVALPMGSSITEVLDESAEGQPLKQDVQEKIQLKEAEVRELTALMEKVIAYDRTKFGHLPWFSTESIERLLREAPETFDRAFDRWRELYAAARHQYEEAVAKVPQANGEDRRELEQLRSEAIRQLDLLKHQGVGREESDFYPYRYLATEGFLPGYNFPVLPLRAWVPTGDAGEYIDRPRFIAIREFGPGYVLYHEGGKWRIHKYSFDPGKFVKTTLKICVRCGVQADIDCDICPACKSDVLERMESYPMPNAATQPIERITCNDEDRLTRGYDVFHAYGGEVSGRGRVQDLLDLSYYPSARLVLINRGIRGSTSGYLIHPTSGLILTDQQAQEQQVFPSTIYVEEYRNMLRLRLHDVPQEGAESFVKTLMYSLERAIEHYYQLEEDELQCFVAGDRWTDLIFWEAAEGGSGALERILIEQHALRDIASAALELLHFDPQTLEDRTTDRHMRCYECLMTYRNQRDADQLNRLVVKDFLGSLSRSNLELMHDSADREVHYARLCEALDSRSELERKVLDYLMEHGHRLPDYAQYLIESPHCYPDFYYENGRVCVFCDGSVHDDARQREQDRSIRDALLDRGYRVIAIRYSDDLSEVISRYPEVFGEPAS